MKFLVVSKSKDVQLVCDYFSDKKVIGLDTETTALEPVDGNLRLIQVSDGKKAVIIDIFKLLIAEGREGYSLTENFYLFEPIKTLLESPNVEVVIHNSKFEEKWLSTKCNISPTKVFDTFLASQNIDYNSSNDYNKAHNLGAVARRFLDIDLDKAEQLSDWSSWELTQEQLEYAAMDVWYLPALRDAMLKEIARKDLYRACKIDFEVVPAIAHTEMNGVHVDRELYTKEISTLLKLEEEAAKNLQGVLKPTTGITVVQPNMFGIPDKDFGDVLLTSSSQVLEALKKLGVPVYKSTEVDAIAKCERAKKPYAIGTGEKALSVLASDYPVVALLMDFRGVEKSTSAFGYNFLEHLRIQEDGTERVHPTFYIIGAPTGRMACRKPNLQQVPNGQVSVGEFVYDLGFRKAFNFPSGKVGINADYSQIELRIAGEFSGDPIFYDAFAVTGRDLHALTASSIFNVPYESCDKGGEHYHTHRTFAKRINFGILYGIGPKGLSAQLKNTVDEAKIIIDKHKETHPVLWDYLNRQANLAIKTLRAKTASGRTQFFNAPSKDEFGEPDRGEVAAIGRNGKNMPIQGCLGFNNRILVQGVGYVKIGSAQKVKSEVWDGTDWVNAFVSDSGYKDSVTVRFNGGNSIECSPSHKFQTYSKGKELAWVEATNLTNKSRVLMNKLTPDFDFFDRGKYKSLEQISSKRIGILLALYSMFSTFNGSDVTITIPELETVARDTLEYIFDTVGIKYTTELKYRSLENDVRYVANRDHDLFKELEQLRLKSFISEDIWASKVVLSGYLSTVFNFARMSRENLQISCPNGRIQLLYDIQQALMLFGVGSKVVKRLMKTTLTIKGNHFYMLLKTVSVLKPKKFKQFYTEKRFKEHTRNTIRTLTVNDVINNHKQVPMFDVVDSDSFKYIANGVVTHNTSADILKRALTLLHNELKGLDAKIVNIVHDEITVEVSKDIAEDVRILVQKAMVDAGEEFLERIPVKVDAKIVDSWSEK